MTLVSPGAAGSRHRRRRLPGLSKPAEHMARLIHNTEYRGWREFRSWESDEHSDSFQTNACKWRSNVHLPEKVDRILYLFGVDYPG